MSKRSMTPFTSFLFLVGNKVSKSFLASGAKPVRGINRRFLKQGELHPGKCWSEIRTHTS